MENQMYCLLTTIHIIHYTLTYALYLYECTIMYLCLIHVTGSNESIWTLADAFELMFLQYVHVVVSRQNPFGEYNNQKGFINILCKHKWKMFIFYGAYTLFSPLFSISLSLSKSKAS